MIHLAKLSCQRNLLSQMALHMGLVNALFKWNCTHLWSL